MTWTQTASQNFSSRRLGGDGGVYHTSAGGAIVSAAVRQDKCAVGAILPVIDWPVSAPRDLQRAR